MQAVIIQMVIILHAAFGCVFLFLYRQHPGRFSRLMAQSWLLEALRAGITLSQLDDTGGWLNHWHSETDRTTNAAEAFHSVLSKLVITSCYVHTGNMQIIAGKVLR